MRQYYTKLELDHYHQDLVKYLCKKIIESITRCNTFDTVIESINEGYDISEEEFDKYYTSQSVRFKHIHSNPNELLSLDDIDMSIFKHMLTNYCFEVKRWEQGWKTFWTIFDYEEWLEEHKN